MNTMSRSDQRATILTVRARCAEGHEFEVEADDGLNIYSDLDSPHVEIKCPECGWVDAHA